jgi:glycosyltransferase involved in cell wall biosynthesis
MVTNVYCPKVGGVTRSIESFVAAYRAAGHSVKVMAPSYPGYTVDETDVLRVPAVHEVLDGSYSLPVPYPGMLAAEIDRFPPDIVHAHHPFLLGATGHKLAATAGVPIVYTHHVRFDAYGAYFPSEHGFMHNFVEQLAVHFANLCDSVIAPGTFVRHMLVDAGVTVPIEIIPTGVDCARFFRGDGQRLRRELGIPLDVAVVGHVGRLAPEKNLELLADGISMVLAVKTSAHAIIGGAGEMRPAMESCFAKRGVHHRVHFLGMVEGERLLDCYHAMTVFAFASQSETQGIVITEAMAAGVPVVALAAPGVEDVLVDGENGRFVRDNEAARFAATILKQLHVPCDELRRMSLAARRAAEQISLKRCATRALTLYERLIDEGNASSRSRKYDSQATWEAVGRRLKDEFLLLQRVSRAARAAFVELNAE